MDIKNHISGSQYDLGSLFGSPLMLWGTNLHTGEGMTLKDVDKDVREHCKDHNIVHLSGCDHKYTNNIHHSS